MWIPQRHLLKSTDRTEEMPPRRRKVVLDYPPLCLESPHYCLTHIQHVIRCHLVRLSLLADIHENERAAVTVMDNL